jgi:peptide chain release factor 1
VHKVIRVPETEAKGRLHSSTASMVVMPAVPFDFSFNEKDLKYAFTRSSGPGGQAVNKTDSACRVTHIPTGLSVFNQEDRSQDQNKKRAIEILKQKIFEI